MQSDKKFRREPRSKMLAHEFALTYANNVENLSKALANAQRFEFLARENAGRITERLEKKNATHVANFWLNVQGILLKHQKGLKETKK